MAGNRKTEISVVPRIPGREGQASLKLGEEAVGLEGVFVFAVEAVGVPVVAVAVLGRAAGVPFLVLDAAPHPPAQRPLGPPQFPNARLTPNRWLSTAQPKVGGPAQFLSTGTFLTGEDTPKNDQVPPKIDKQYHVWGNQHYRPKAEGNISDTVRHRYTNGRQSPNVP